jgi:tripartite-type tricarboxylate transporter receptor subunit TctC
MTREEIPAIHLRMLFTIAALFAGIASAQPAGTYPSRPIRIVVSSAPGGTIDTVTRLVAQKLTEDMGQSVIVENQAGGGTLVATRAVKAAAPDGYTLLATSNSITSVPALRLTPGYDLLKDLVPVAQMVRSPWFLVVGAAQPDRSFTDLIGRAKANPGKLTFASSGIGTSPHLASELLAKRAGIQVMHIPYKGNGAAMPDVISGRVTMILEGPAAAMPKVKAGQFRILGVTAANRLEAFPDVPTLAEQGAPGYSAEVYAGLFAPAGTPPEVVEKVAAAVKKATSSGELRIRLLAEGMQPGTMSAQQFREALALELVDTAKLVESLGIPKE